jgi:serine protease inhibitor
MLGSYKKLESTPNDRNALLSVASLAIYSTDFKVRKSFRANLLSNFFTPLAKTNFTVFGDETLESVNRWVTGKTHGRVQQLMTAPLHPDTRLALMIAFAFRGDWLHEFEKRLFTEREFHNADGTATRLPMMFRRGAYRYLSTPNHGQLIEIPYHGEFVMYVLLPDKGQSVHALLSQLNSRRLDAMQMQMQNTSIELFLPRFRVDFGLQLIPMLQEFGVRTAFGPNADFGGISSSGQAFVSSAVHRAFVEVNEKGTEAAAATAIGVSIKSGGYAVKMLVDRPFAFVIKDLQNNLDLFSGIIKQL